MYKTKLNESTANKQNTYKIVILILHLKKKTMNSVQNRKCETDKMKKTRNKIEVEKEKHTENEYKKVDRILFDFIA